MTYFLDFDRVLFDTDSYIESLPDEPGCAPFKEELLEVIAAGRDETLTGSDKRIAAWEKVSEAIHSGTLRFAPGALARFVYPDVPEFLRAAGNEAIIISYGEKDRQRVKIENALMGIPRLTVLYVGTESKASFFSKWPGYNGGEALLVDDRIAELEELSRAFPSIKLYEMRRDQKEGDGRWPVIHSLSNLP